MSFLNRDIGDYLFYASLTIFVSLTFTANIEAVAGALLPLSYVALAMLALAFVVRIRRYRASEVYAICGLGAVGLYQFFENGDSTLMKFALLLAALKGIPFNRCIRYDLVLRLLWTVTLVALSYAGYAEDIVTSDALRGARHSLGFSNANQLGMAVLIACLEALYLMDFRLRPAPTAVIVVIALWLDVVSGSRSSTMFILLALALAAVNTVSRGRLEKSTVMRRMSELAVPCLFLLTWCVAWFYQQGASWAIELNELMTNRVGHIDAYTDLFIPQAFGSDLSAAGMTLDTLYAYLVYGYGVVVTMAYIVAEPILMRRLHSLEGGSLSLVFLLLSLYGLSERLWFCVEYNALMLGFGALVFGSEFRFSDVGDGGSGRTGSKATRRGIVSR